MKNFTWHFFIKLSVFLILLGRAYQFYFFGAPFRAILWDESLLSPIIESIFDIPWSEYATNTKYSDYINTYSKVCSIILLVGAFTSLFWERIRFIKLKKAILSLCVFILFILGICIFKDKNYSILQVFELFIQISLPFVMLIYLDRKDSSTPIDNITKILKIAVSVTFFAHGLYAMGIPFYPGHFIDMTISITGLTEDQAKIFLTVAGSLDIAAAILIYFKPTARYALNYILVWGLLTAFARVVSGFNSDFIFNSIHNSLYATVYRIPHGLIALVLIFITYSQIRLQKSLYYEA